MSNLVPKERIESKIFLIRVQRVMLDRDLADLYGVTTFRLNEQVKRNIERFPEDFMFQLTKEEWQNLKFQTGISNLKSQNAISSLKPQFETSNLKSQNVMSSWGGRRTLPYAFTEQGVAMLSSVLRSKRAIRVNIAIMRIFTRLRNILLTHKESSKKFNDLERQVGSNMKDIRNIFQVIRSLKKSDENPKKMGFRQ